MDQRTRDLRNVCEPIGANVYFAPEAHAKYAELGLGGYGPGYFCSRGASLGKPSGLVVTSAFGVFSPAVVVPAVDEGWSKTEPAPLLQARYDGAVASLRRLLGEPDAKQLDRAVELLQRGLDVAEGAGHPLFSGLKSLPVPARIPSGSSGAAATWCASIAATATSPRGRRRWSSPIEIQLMSELQMGIPLKTYSATRGWTVAADGRRDRRHAREGLDGRRRLLRRGPGVPRAHRVRHRRDGGARSSMRSAPTSTS